MQTLRKWSITLITAVVTATVLLIPTLLLTTGGSDAPAQQRPDTPAAAAPRAAAPVGPEGVPLVTGKPLGPARSPRPGQSSGGIPCGSTEQLAYHVHAHLAIFVNGKPRAIPLGVGIGAPVRTTQNAGGPFASNGSCFSFLHTHAADGIIHIEAPAAISFTLGQFFDVWQQRLDPRNLGRTGGRVVAYVDGRRYHGDPRAIVLRRHTQIQLSIGRPGVVPKAIDFPAGL